MNNTPKDFIEKIKKNTEEIKNKFITGEEIEKNKKYEDENQRKDTLVNNLKDSVVKILVEDLTNNSIKYIYKAYCTYEGGMLWFSPQEPNDNKEIGFACALNPIHITTEFVAPGTGLNESWHITKLY